MTEPITILDQDDIARILMRMTHEILEVHKGAENLVLIGIQTRGVHIARRICENITALEGIKVPAGNVDITLYRDDWTRKSIQPVVQATDIFFNLDDKQIILTDDVLFTGRTTRAAMDAIIDFGRPQRIELAVLVDRGHRELPIQADYVGKVIETRRTEFVSVLVREHDGTDRVVMGEKAAIR
jgi:pyrimidine operon attenuation protein / uracil phosphoribosyltransferase